MNFLRGSIKQIYFKYLAAAFGSAMITSIYSIVDMAMVGQYQGPDGTAALAVAAPVWNIIYSLGLLTGIGGSVVFSIERGSSARHTGSENQYFTVAVIGSVFLAGLAWAALLLLEVPLLSFFGADQELLPLAQQYLKPIKFVFPLFLFNQMLAAFLRNDSNPTLATIAVLSGGVFNVFGDWFFVFPCNMGMYGAGLATAIGSVVSFCVIVLAVIKCDRVERRQVAVVRRSFVILHTLYAFNFLYSRHKGVGLRRRNIAHHDLCCTVCDKLVVHDIQPLLGFRILRQIECQIALHLDPVAGERRKNQQNNGEQENQISLVHDEGGDLHHCRTTVAFCGITHFTLTVNLLHGKAFQHFRCVHFYKQSFLAWHGFYFFQFSGQPIKTVW